MCFDTEKTQAPANEVPRHLQERLKREADRDARLYAGGEVGTAAMPISEEQILAEIFKYHPPTSDQLPKFQAINQAAKNFAEVVTANCPGGPDRVTAIFAIRVARMMANAAISLRGLAL